MSAHLALYWDTRDPRADARAAMLAEAIARRRGKWALSFAAPGARVHHRGAPCLPLPEGRGCVIGDLFEGGGACAGPAHRVSAKDRSVRGFAPSRGAALIERHWGDYIAFLVDPAARRLDILRDPSGASLCFHACRDGVRLVFSDPRDALDLGMVSRAPDWEGAVIFLLRGRLQTRRTALRGVQELQPGERLSLTPDDSRYDTLWRPASFCAAPARASPVDDAAALRTAIYGCADAWVGAGAGTSPMILHRLSGGLDSTIALAALARRAPAGAIACVHYYVRDLPEADERLMAREAAAAVGAPLTEVAMAPADIDYERALTGALHARPSTALLSFADTRPADLVRALGADLVTSGSGGDNLFFRHKSPAIAADALRASPWAARSWRSVLDTARSSRRSVWDAGAFALLHGPCRRSWDVARQFPAHAHFVTADAAMSVPPDALSPIWYRDAPDLPPGKRVHLWILADALNYRTPSILDMVAPYRPILLSQPVIEACLATPTYRLAAGGRDRALARAAFASALPPNIVARESKGLTTRYFAEVLRANANFMRATLLDGNLVRRRMLDKARLERALHPGALAAGADVSGLLTCLSAELWLAILAAAGTGEAQPAI